MNKTKMIYFLSAIVCIIGCYTLNLSYSLFVQTEEREVINATVPSLSYSLINSENVATFSNRDNHSVTVAISANSEEIVKLKVLNSGTSNIRYGVSVDETFDTSIQLVEIDNGNIVNELASSTIEGDTTSKEFWVYITNPTNDEVKLTFRLTAKYSTLNFDDEAFISSSNIDNINTIKLLKDEIIARAKSNEIIDETKTVYNETFNLNNTTDISSETERILALAEDDYGTSYVFRGAVKDNYVKFAGFTWRIVRINGDGSIRLVLDGTLDKVTDCNDENICTTSKFNDIDLSSGDNAYIGYMYGTPGSDNYNETHKNITNSTIKTKIDSFYEKFLKNSESYIADTLFCGDKSLSSSSTNGGYGNLDTFYSIYERLDNNSSISSRIVTLECAQNETNNYSRYTSKLEENEETLKNVNINNDLLYPIGLMSADEIIMAGGTNINNDLNSELTYYLSDGYKYKSPTLNSNWWTMNTTNLYSAEPTEYYVLNVLASEKAMMSQLVSSEAGIRPVINLKMDTVVSGRGIYDDPYIVK